MSKELGYSPQALFDEAVPRKDDDEANLMWRRTSAVMLATVPLDSLFAVACFTVVKQAETDVITVPAFIAGAMAAGVAATRYILARSYLLAAHHNEGAACSQLADIPPHPDFLPPTPPSQE